MGLFVRKKPASPARGEEAAVRSSEAGVKILGSGCAKCRRLEANTREALKQLGVDAAVEHVTDFAEIAAYGVLTTPALVVDGKALSREGGGAARGHQTSRRSGGRARRRYTLSRR